MVCGYDRAFRSAVVGWAPVVAVQGAESESELMKGHPSHLDCLLVRGSGGVLCERSLYPLELALNAVAAGSQTRRRSIQTRPSQTDGWLGQG